MRMKKITDYTDYDTQVYHDVSCLDNVLCIDEHGTTIHLALFVRRIL